MNASDEAIQQRLDEIYRQVSLIEAQVNGTDYAQNPIATTRVYTCLENVECLSTLESLESWVDAMDSNDPQIIFEFDQQTYEQIYLDLNNNWDLPVWDLHALPENFRSTILYLRSLRLYPDTYEVECYKDEPIDNQNLSCNTAIKELLYHYLPLAKEDDLGEWQYQERYFHLLNFFQEYRYSGFVQDADPRRPFSTPNLGLSLSSEHKILLREFDHVTRGNMTNLILDIEHFLP